MSLADHARAAHLIAASFVAQAFAAEGDHVELLAHIGNAYEMAADQMDKQIRADADQAQRDHACTLEHLKGKVCPACGQRA